MFFVQRSVVVAVLVASCGLVRHTEAQLVRDTGFASEHRTRLDSLLRLGRVEPGPKAAPQRLQLLYAARVRNPFQRLLQRADTLRLTNSQADRIASLNVTFSSRAAREWTRLADSLTALPEQYDLDAAWSHVNSTANTVLSVLAFMVADVQAILTDEQHANLPSDVQRMLIPDCVRLLFPTAGPLRQTGISMGAAELTGPTPIAASRLAPGIDCAT